MHKYAANDRIWAAFGCQYIDCLGETLLNLCDPSNQIQKSFVHKCAPLQKQSSKR